MTDDMSETVSDMIDGFYRPHRTSPVHLRR